MPKSHLLKLLAASGAFVRAGRGEPYVLILAAMRPIHGLNNQLSSSVNVKRASRDSGRKAALLWVFAESIARHNLILSVHFYQQYNLHVQTITAKLCEGYVLFRV